MFCEDNKSQLLMEDDSKFSQFSLRSGGRIHHGGKTKYVIDLTSAQLSARKPAELCHEGE